jgi:hypothetical protein
MSCIASDFEKESVFLTNRHTIVSKCNTKVRCDWFVRFPCRHIDVSQQEKQVDRLPRSHCNSGNLGKQVGFAATIDDNSPRFDLQVQTPRFGEFGGTSRSTASVCSIFLGRMTTSHPLPRRLRARQVRASLQVLDWSRPFFSQETGVGRLTPKVRWIAHILDRSE